MGTNGRIEHVKKIGKNMKKACPVELRLGQARTGLARALGFPDWLTLTKVLLTPFSVDFQNQATMVSPNPNHPTFLAAVKRFAESAGVEHSVANALCIEFLPSALEKWRSWKPRATFGPEPVRDHSKHPKVNSTMHPLSEPDSEPLRSVSAVTSDRGLRTTRQKGPVPVVVRKKRRIVPPDLFRGGENLDPH